MGIGSVSELLEVTITGATDPQFAETEIRFVVARIQMTLQSLRENIEAEQQRKGQAAPAFTPISIAERRGDSYKASSVNMGIVCTARNAIIELNTHSQLLFILSSCSAEPYQSLPTEWQWGEDTLDQILSTFKFLE